MASTNFDDLEHLTPAPQTLVPETPSLESSHSVSA
jgi:hypothetical protein